MRSNILICALILLLLGFLLSSCLRKEDRGKCNIIPKMSESASFKQLSSYILIDYFPCLLRVIKDYNDECSISEDYIIMDSYKVNDTVFLIFDDGYPRDIKITIINGYYEVKIHYRTTLMGTFPESKDDYGLYYEPKLMYHEVYIDKEDIKVGDTINGLFYLVTEKYRYEDYRKSESIYGIFKTTINNERRKIDDIRISMLDCK